MWVKLVCFCCIFLYRESFSLETNYTNLIHIPVIFMIEILASSQLYRLPKLIVIYVIDFSRKIINYMNLMWNVT